MAADARALAARAAAAERKTPLPDDPASDRARRGVADGLGPLLEGLRLRSAPLDPDAALLPEEEPLVKRAVASRRREFATGRVLARALLADLGFAAEPLLRDEDRVPLWPAPLLGSISHSRDWCLVAVAPGQAALGLGVDVERDHLLAAELVDEICMPGERRQLGEASQRRAEATLLFSIKEAVYKACFPKQRRVWGFDEVEVELDWRGADAGFRARPPADTPGTITGRVVRRGGLVFSAAVWRADASAAPVPRRRG